jgi:antitoxin VapB
MVEFRLPRCNLSLNIKSPEAHELARRVAERTGESLTLAVTVALQERLEHLMRAENQKATAQQILAIGRRCAAVMDRPVTDHGALLYDEFGAPK